MKPLLPSFFSILSIAFILLFVTVSSVEAITINVCPTAGANCAFIGAGGIQEAVDAAKDGDIIAMNGTFSSSSILTPFSGRMNVTSCFVNLNGKSLTLKGGTLFGQGHQLGTHDQSDPYFHRAGICSKGGKITIDGMHINEFEGGAMEFFDSQVTLKNNVIDWNDHGAIFIFNSALLAVNNYFLRGPGIMPFGNSIVKAYNNNFVDSKAIIAAISCNDDVPPMDFVNNVVVEEELTIGIGGLSTNCPEKVTQFKNRHIGYNLQWKKGNACYAHEYCDSYTGLVNVDPQIDGNNNATVGVSGVGDPSVPGIKDIGAQGGTCTEPSSIICLAFIQSNRSTINNPSPTLTLVPTIRIIAPTQNPNYTPRPTITNAFSNNPSRGPIPTLNPSLLAAINAAASISAPISASGGMDIFLFVLLSFVYIMVVHFALGIGDGFNIFLMVIYFLLAAVIGWWFHNLEAGFIFGIVLSLLFL